MKFTIEVEDFYLDEDEDLREGLKAHIKRDVVAQISKNIKEQTDKQITEKVSEAISQKLALVIDSTLNDLTTTGMITFNREEISIVDHIKKVFMNSTGWSNPNAQIQKIAKAFTVELKTQYDMVFANRIVANLKEQGFLKDDLVQVLLTDKQGE